MQNNYNRGSAFRSEVTYAGFWVRLAAYFLDSVIVFLLLLLVRLVLLGMTAWMDGTILDGNLLFHYSFQDIVLYAGQVLYFILFTYTSGTTPGKKAMNLRVTGAKEDEKPTLFTVVYRETVGRFLSGFFVGIGYWIIGMNPQKQGIHDMLCDTHVIYARRVKVMPVYQGEPRPQVPIPPYPPKGPSSSGQEMEKGMPSVSPGDPYRMVKEELHAGEISRENNPGNFYPVEPASGWRGASGADRIPGQRDERETWTESAGLKESFAKGGFAGENGDFGQRIGQEEGSPVNRTDDGAREGDKIE
ncbi:MAG: RDD family protein [Ruminococcus sp.]|nr:RDD family protein [Ruminococcus sp.]